MPFLPVTKEDMTIRDWKYVDFVLVTGDSYVDHPSFGAAIISRLLESFGYKVAILSQPDFKSCEDFKRFGRPRLGFMVTAGNIDSMVAHYTAAKKKRSDDAYTAGNTAGKRPDRACAVYTRLIREAYGDIPVILGGLEASLRRFAHYDYWNDAVMPSILIGSNADILIYGMAEKALRAVANALDSASYSKDLSEIRGICYAVAVGEYSPLKAVECPSFEQVCSNKKEYAKAARFQQDEHDSVSGRRLIQKHGKTILVQNAPSPCLTQDEMDEVYALPFERSAHPMYDSLGGVPALSEVKFSITHNRGCFGSCNFCSLAFHQGRKIMTRSKESVLKEAEGFTKDGEFKGYIHDVGGPTANFRSPSCDAQEKNGLCKGRKCLTSKCKNLKVSHAEYLSILRDMRKINGIKRVFIRSGIRYDYLLKDDDSTFFKELVEHHVSGQLKVAPEHCSPIVLDMMGKPHIESYLEFARRFKELTKSKDKKQYLVPYLMSSHPGAELKDAAALALFLKKENIRPEQVQDFYPTPGTISTCMYYTGLDPYTMKEVYVPKSQKEKTMQRALLQYFLPQNSAIVRQALLLANRRDLIGHTQNCLVRPDSSAKTVKGGQIRKNENKKQKK